ncbi:hypothetical protein [Xylanimonas ulmi]|uniref:Uncharacterized protein n=1 Tax=Xylanimonas ulmi TaxID=228973 RepID=A0A4Q7LZZ6_9MICO|nr:hypothetical protein [Xylanibacterium ulmi]RZS61045.1 hypothetical protein EV386_1326 [Xylanibacterium ulmi]
MRNNSQRRNTARASTRPATTKRPPSRAERIARRGFAVAWALAALFAVTAVVVVVVGAVTRTIPDVAEGVFQVTPDYPLLVPPLPLLSASALLLVLLALWTIPLRIDESLLTHRLVQAALCGLMLFGSLFGSLWWAQEFGPAGETLMKVTVGAYVAAAVLFFVRLVLELVRIVPRRWRSDGPNASDLLDLAA